MDNLFYNNLVKCSSKSCPRMLLGTTSYAGSMNRNTSSLTCLQVLLKYSCESLENNLPCRQAFSVRLLPLFVSLLALPGQIIATVLYPELHAELCHGSGDLVEVFCVLVASTFEKFLMRNGEIIEVYCTKN